MKKIKLYSYWRSTAAFRVRIALNIKQIDYQYEAVHLVKNGGQQLTDFYKSKNPQALVPALELENGQVLTQSLAIIDYLEEKYPEVSLYPNTSIQKAQAKAMALAIACDIHPLNNLRVLKYLKKEAWQQEQVDAWYAHWIHQGFAAIEEQLKKTAKHYCFGNEISVADIFLVAQVYNANRFSVSLQEYSKIVKINENCLQNEAFIQALPENQEDCDIT